MEDVQGTLDNSTPLVDRDLVNGPRRWTEDAIREWHNQNCPRISEREASCFACSLFELLSQARKRHVRYLEMIRAAIGDDRLRRDNGEPATSDANELRRLIAERNRLRRIVETLALPSQGRDKT